MKGFQLFGTNGAARGWIQASACAAAFVVGIWLMGCSEERLYPDVERGTFVITIEGLAEDTIRGNAFVRDRDGEAPGIELDADSLGWSMNWMPSELEATEYPVLMHALVEQARAAEGEDEIRRQTEAIDDRPHGVSLFMQHPVHGDFEGQSGVVTIERITETDIAGELQAEMSVDAESDPVLSIQGRWHAIPGPNGLPSHLQPESN